MQTVSLGEIFELGGTCLPRGEAERPRADCDARKFCRVRVITLACFDVELLEKRVLFAISGPTITPPPGATTLGYQNEPLVLSTANGNAISVTDSAAGAGKDVVSLSVANGTLSLANSASLTFSTGGASGFSTIVFSGTIASINSALDGLEFSPSGSFHENTTLGITVTDPSDSLSSNANVNLNIQQPPAPAISAPSSIVGYQNMAAVFSGGNAISITDDEAGFNSYTETVTLAVGNGVLNLGSSTGLSFATGAASGTSDIVFSGSLLNVNNALSGLTFNPTASYHGATALHITIEDDGDVLTGSANVNINVQTPSAPTAVFEGAANGYQNTPLVLSALNGNQVLVNDPEAGSNFDTVSLSASQGVLTLASSTGLTFTTGSATSSSAMVFTGSIASINNALNGMQYQPNAGFQGNATLLVGMLDQGDALSGSASERLNIQSPAQPTVITQGSASGYANQALILSANYGDQISINDLEAQFGGYTDTVTMTASNGTLDFPSAPGLTFILGSAAGSSTVEFSGTLNNINNALNGMYFQPTAGFQGGTQLDISITDGGDSQTGSGHVNLTIQPDPAPTISGTGTINGAENQTLIISQQSGKAISINDVGAGLGSDVVTLTVGNGTLDLASTAGITITSGAATGSSTIIFSGSVVAINNALNGLAFNPTTSFQGIAPLTITVNNPVDSLSHTGNVNLNIQLANPLPTIALPSPQTTATNTSIVFSSGNGNAITIGDAKTQPNADTITLMATNGTLTLGSTSGLTIQTGGPSTWVVSGTIANLQNAMNGLTFTPTGGFDGLANLAITLTSNAGGQTLSASAALPIAVSTALAAPMIGVPPRQSTAQNSPVVFSSAAGDQIWISDLGSTGGPQQVTLSSSLGRLSLSQVAGLTFSAGTGTSDAAMTFTGTLASINAALNGLIYTPSRGSIGTDPIQISVNDLGDTVAGTPQTANASANVTIVNAAPTVAIAAAASPSIVTGTTAILSVLGADDAGESNLTYTWSQTNSAGAPVLFSANGTNASKNTFVTFSAGGTYYFSVTIADAQGSSVTTSTQVDVVLGATNAANGPAISVPGAQTTAKNVPLTFSFFGGNAIQMSSSQGGAISVTLSATNGMLTLPSVSGLTFQTGSGVGDVTMTFTATTVGAITAALNGFTFTPIGNFVGFGAISVSATQGSVTSYQSVPISISAGANQPPTVAQAAAASPNPLAGTSTSLSVLGADDGGESNLIYSWSVLSKPAGALSPSFSLNGSNDAKNTVATFSQAGSYTLLVTITDAGGLSTTSQVIVQVNQTLTSINVTPGNNVIGVLGTLQFNATALDQFGQAMQSQPTFSWNTSEGPGLLSELGLLTSSLVPGNYTVSASSGGVTGVANYTTVAGGTAVASPSPVTGTTTTLSVIGGLGLSYTWSVLSKPAGAIDPSFSVNGSLAAQSTIATFSSVGSYVFQVDINTGLGTSTQTVAVDVDQTLTSVHVSPASASLNENQQTSFTAVGLDQFGAAMASAPNFSWVVSSGGGSIDQTGLYTAPGAGHAGAVTIAAQSGGVSGSANVTVVNAAPTVAQTAAALPSTVTGKTAILSVLGDDDGGESNLMYSWGATGPAVVSLSNNNSNQAKWVTATFARAGTYTLTATISDTEGRSTTSDITITVQQTVTHLNVLPGAATVNENSTQQFAVTATDQFGRAIASPGVSWSIAGGGGTINSSGLFTAPATPGTATIEAISGGVTATALVTIPNQPPTVAIAAAAAPNPVTGTTTTLSVLGADDGGESNLDYIWGSTGPGPVVFSDNDTNSAQNTTATFSAAGTYQLLVTIMDQGGLSTTSSVTVTVDQTFSRISVTPATSFAERAGTVSLSALALDQFGAAMQSQPIFNWSVVGAEGSIDASGVYTAPPSGNGSVMILASSGGISGSANVQLIDDLAASVPTAQVIQEDSSLTFENSNAITVSDADANTQNVPASITLSAANGTISLANLNGLTLTAGNGAGSSMTFSGQVADLDSALQGMVFTPAHGFAGRAAVDVTINETGSAGPINYSIPITVQPLAAAPSPTTGSTSGTTGGTGAGGVTAGGAPTGAVASGGAGPLGGATGISGVLSGDTGNSSATSGVLNSSPDVTTGATGIADAPIVLGGDAPAPAPNAGNAPAPQAAPAGNGPAQPPPANPAAKPAANNAGNAAKNAGAPPTKAAANATPQIPAGVPEVRVVTVPSQVFSFLGSQSPMTQEIDDVKNQMVSQKAMKIAAGSATVVSLGTSAVYFVWLLRGGSLLSSMLSVLPAWKSIDPLPVLEHFESRRRRKQRMASDRESLESLIDQSTDTANRLSAKARKSDADSGQESV